MRLVTWNVNSLRARLPRVLELLALHAPDVACIQETKVSGETFPHDALAAAGYEAFHRSEGRWNGVALLAPLGAQVEDVVLSLPGEPNPAEARWIEATVQGVRVASVYVPNGREPGHPMFAEKLAFFEAMRDQAELMVAQGPTVIAGDVNVAPEDRDVWDPALFVGSTHVTPEERTALRAVIASGMVDAHRACDAEEPGFTYWDYRMGAFRRNMGMRIDLALVSAQLGIRSCTVDTTFRRNNAAGDKPSDHAPLVLELDTPTP